MDAESAGPCETTAAQLADARVACDAKQVELEDLRAAHASELVSLQSRLEDVQARAGRLAEDLKVTESARQEAIASIEERFRETARLTEIVFALEESIDELEATRVRRDTEHSAQLSSLAQQLAGDRQAHAEQIRTHAHQSALAEFELTVRRRHVALLETRLNEWAAVAQGYRDALRSIRSSKVGKLLRGLLPAPGLPSEPKTASDIAHEVWVVRQSDLFNETWYRANYFEPGDEGVDPVVHYLRDGAFLGFNPGPNFNTVDYLSRYPDVRKSGINPLIHFLEHGANEGRSAAVPPSGDA